MDARTFDRWTAAVAHRPTRRAAIRLLAGGLLGGVLAQRETAPARAAQIDVVDLSPGSRFTCVAQGLTDCGGVCVDVSSDPANCGACGSVCAMGDACIGGWCQTLAVSDTTVTDVIADLELTCAAQGLTDCGGVCVDLTADADHCGRCSSSCVLGAICQGGVCTFVGCPAGLTYCESWGCVDLNTDVNNCGGCGVGCFGGYSCVNGACV